MSGYGPEFARGILEEIDRAAAAIAAAVADGKAQSHEEYVRMCSERRGLLMARGAVVARLDDETRRLLGLPVRERPRPHAV